MTTESTKRGHGSPALSRRRVLQLGLAAVPAAFGAQLLGSGLATSTDAVRAAGPDPSGGAYDPSAHDWAFVMDTTTCIGCGRCVDACKQENHVPPDPELNRTWVELHVQADDWTVSVSSPQGGGPQGGSSSAELSSWVTSACTAVTAGGTTSTSVYDCSTATGG